MMAASNSTPDEPPAEPEERALMDDLAGSEPAPSAGGFSLASLFLLLTASGVIAALARNISRAEIQLSIVTVHAVIGGFIGGVAGAMIGFSYPRRVSGACLGWFVGALTGGVCAGMAGAGGNPWLFCVGAAALLALGLASRWMHHSG